MSCYKLILIAINEKWTKKLYYVNAHVTASTSKSNRMFYSQAKNFNERKEERERERENNSMPGLNLKNSPDLCYGCRNWQRPCELLWLEELESLTLLCYLW